MISTHVLDTTLGSPAEGVLAQLDKQSELESWTSLGSERTNREGRISFHCLAETGTYRLIFHLEPYFRQKNIVPFFVHTSVVFQITDTSRKYHVPLLLNPYGCTVYRGS